MTIHSKLALAAGIAALVDVSAASAQQFNAPGQVEISGRTFHVAVCPGPAARGTARCFAHVVTDSRGNPLTSTVTRNATPSGYGPAQLRGAYGINPASGMPGTGATVAIVDAYGYPSAASDLATYRGQFGLGSCTTSNGCLTIVNENGGPNLPRSNTGWDQEQALDLDMVSTMCPNCKILLVQASSSSFADLAAAANYAGMHAHVVSNSYGGGENGSNTYEASYNHNGVAVTASTGDSGFGAQFPATSPHVIAVGGTTLHLTGSNTRQSETAWSGGGSGCSTLYNEPSWQLPSNANMTTNTLCTMRMEADVSADADPNTGVAVYGPANRRGSAWLVFGGTSVAAPLIGGIFGEKNNAVNFAQTIYTNSSSLFDVTSGTNGSCGGTYFCVAGPHYDGPTGLGTPNGDTAF